MNPITRILLFLILPIIAVLAYPPDLLLNGLPLIAATVVMFAGLGFLVWRGRSLALTLSIFLQGLNIIVRLMMFFPHATTTDGQLVLPFAIATIFGMALSFYLMLRLDQGDVRIQMVA